MNGSKEARANEAAFSLAEAGFSCWTRVAADKTTVTAERRKRELQNRKVLQVHTIYIIN